MNTATAPHRLPLPALPMWAAASLCLATLGAQAQAQPAPAQQPASGLPLWEAGAIGLAVSQQAYPGADQRVNRVLPLPYLVYRGELLRADRESVGLRAIRTPDYELDIGAAASLGAGSDDIDVRRGMPKLGTLVEFGPRLKVRLGQTAGGGRARAEVALRGVFDLSDGLAGKGVAFEPKLVYEDRFGDAWRWSTSAAAVFGSRRLADTFYGVAPAYATATRPAYAADAGLIAWRFGANVSRPLTPDLRLFAFARLDTVAGAANRDSPLVQRRTGPSVGLSLVYTFARSAQRVDE